MADEPLVVPVAARVAASARTHTASLLLSVPLVDAQGAFVRTLEVEVAMDDPALLGPQRVQLMEAVQVILRMKGAIV